MFMVGMDRYGPFLIPPLLGSGMAARFGLNHVAELLERNSSNFRVF